MAFDKTFDEILNQLLTNLRNQDPTIDVSKGSPTFVRCAALASALWGLNRDGAYVDRQRFADGADEETLDHYIALRLDVIEGETVSSKRARVTEDIRHPPAGGNKYDYVRWAGEASPLVASATCIRCGQGPGTIDVVITANADETGSEIPTADLLATVRAYIVDKAPNDVKFLRVLAPEVLLVDVTIARTGTTYPADDAIADITTYMSAFLSGQVLYLDQLKPLALGGGEGKAPVSAPADDVTPTAYQMVRPGVINVT